jgi:uroporphyrinogen decarboxylase
MAMALSPLDVLFYLRQMENGMYDLFDYPDECQAFVNRVADYEVQLVEGLADRDVDIVYIAGDICSATGPMLSWDMLVRYVFEPVSKITDAAKKLGIPIFYHTDGAVSDVLDLFVEYGFDGINPLQPHLNDIGIFKKKYGDRLLLYGGLDNCYAIPDSTADGVRRHVRDTFDILGKDGGWIASSHDIPDYVPMENLEALTDELICCVY